LIQNLSLAPFFRPIGRDYPAQNDEKVTGVLTLTDKVRARWKHTELGKFGKTRLVPLGEFAEQRQL
jgi:hypothetical protein